MSFNYHQSSFVLENGTSIDLTINYHTFGTLNANRDNVVWVCHALTANSNVLEWWDGLFGAHHLYDPDEYFIVCANCIGSCYGTTGPSSRYGDDPLLDYFPEVTTRDMARAHDELRNHLGIQSINTLIGASLGGQQALEWAIEQPSEICKLVLIATNANHSAYGIAFNESQRMAIASDRTFGNGQLDGGKEGLAVARSIAMLSYRSYEGYHKTQNEASNQRLYAFRASTYQNYQGQKLANRFCAYSYVALSKAMDAHNVGRNRGTIEQALERVAAKTLVIGISTDALFPPYEQKYLAMHIPKADYVEIHSDYGHDGFLIETEKISDLLTDFHRENYRTFRPTVFKSTIKKNQLMNLTAL